MMNDELASAYSMIGALLLLNGGSAEVYASVLAEVGPETHYLKTTRVPATGSILISIHENNEVSDEIPALEGPVLD